MKYKIAYRGYHNICEDRPGEFVGEIKARSFEIESGFVDIWAEQNGSGIPDIRINANDVLTIEPIKEEKK